ncbi:MAG: NADH:flavin oxidoreductase/NADH oxidase [Planctomycetaceae bacterium]|nr:NADH:flavin oxidoreductase/NADH oxidase [Planctomycetaceae bacterium]
MSSSPEGVTGNSHFQVEVECEAVDLLTPLTIRGVTLPNRIGMSPMCQYSSEEGFANDWHLVHLGSRAAGGAGLVMVEATAVERDGRITPGDMGLWSDAHAEPLARIARFLEGQGAVPAIQLAHAGRKASCDVPWKGGKPLLAEHGGWAVIGPSAVPFSTESPAPVPLDAEGIERVKRSFVSAAERAVRSGFRVIEIHAAHGYLLHSFLSPLSNHRIDRYGGNLENRMRLLLEVAEAVRRVLSDGTPLFVRISATDWVEGGWNIEQSVVLARELKARGVDLIDCSSGALVPVAKIPVEKHYQVPFAARIRRDAHLRTAAVGLITSPLEANEIIARCDADLVLIGRELLRDPYWAHRASHELESDPRWPTQYGYAVRRRVR